MMGKRPAHGIGVNSNTCTCIQSCDSIETWRKRVQQVYHYRQQVKHDFMLGQRFETAYPASLFSTTHVQSRT
jgi:hypothetical protein